MQKKFNNHEMLNEKGKILCVSQHSRLALTHVWRMDVTSFLLSMHDSVCASLRVSFNIFICTTSADKIHIETPAKKTNQADKCTLSMHTQQVRPSDHQVQETP
jgi:hypothetical protein